MRNKRWLLLGFALLSVAQLWVPGWMIWQEEQVVRGGEVFKFRVQPFDPVDPLRGRYVTLRFADNTINDPLITDWSRNETAYITLGVDAEGFAIPRAATREVPTAGEDFLSAPVYLFRNRDSTQRLTVRYPFERFYMQEFKAPRAEALLRERARADSLLPAYALVRVRDGRAVLTDVLVDGVSLQEVAGEEPD